MDKKVSVLMTTYNHEKYIAQAVESVLQQEVSFQYEIVIGDDCSTDRTRDILRELSKAHPERIRLLLREKKGLGIPGKSNFVETLKACQGQYVAMLDGDDYWTDPLKLQKQVDYLEAHQDCAACFHNAQLVFDDASQPRTYCPPDQREVSTLVDIATKCLFIPCTVLFRNKLWLELPEAFFNVLNGDWMLFVMLAEHGYLGYLNEEMAVHRVHGNGIWSKLNQVEQLKAISNSYRVIDNYLAYRYTEIIAEKLSGIRDERTRRALVCLDNYHLLVRKGRLSDALALLFEANRLAPGEILRPRRALSVLKSGIIGTLSRLDKRGGTLR